MTQIRIVTGSQLDTFVHYLTEIDRLQRTASAEEMFSVRTADIRTRTNRPAQRTALIWLETNGFIITHRGRKLTSGTQINRYQLSRPLSDIYLTDLVSCLAMSIDSPMVKLLTFDPTLSLETLNSIEVSPDKFDLPEAPYSFDFIATLLSTLSADTLLSCQQMQDALGEYSRAHTYLSGAIAHLHRLGLVDRKSHRAGYRLFQPFENLTVGDIIPAVSHTTMVFNKILTQTENLRLSLFV